MRLFLFSTSCSPSLTPALKIPEEWMQQRFTGTHPRTPVPLTDGFSRKEKRRKAIQANTGMVHLGNRGGQECWGSAERNWKEKRRTEGMQVGERILITPGESDSGGTTCSE